MNYDDARNVPLTISRINSYLQYIINDLHRKERLLTALQQQNRDTIVTEWEIAYTKYTLGLIDSLPDHPLIIKKTRNKVDEYGRVDDMSQSIRSMKKSDMSRLLIDIKNNPDKYPSTHEEWLEWLSDNSNNTDKF